MAELTDQNYKGYLPYFLGYKAQHFFKENIPVQSKSAPNSGCILKQSMSAPQNTILPNITNG